jgi:hypothetical protein
VPGLRARAAEAARGVGEEAGFGKVERAAARASAANWASTDPNSRQDDTLGDQSSHTGGTLLSRCSTRLRPLGEAVLRRE